MTERKIALSIEEAEKKLIWSECKSSRKKRGGCIWKYCLMKARAECDRI
jgi:hypothetical protein